MPTADRLLLIQASAPNAVPPQRPGWLASLPGQCEVCKAGTSGTTTAALCGDCVQRFGATRPRCRRCGIGTGEDLAACGECLRDPPPFERTLCAVDYGFPWDTLITAFKFEGRVELADALATRLAAAVQDDDRAELVVPVPLSARRLAERGYNQSWELARRVARRLHMPAQASLLQRPQDTRHQADLDRAERRRNLQAAFRVDPRHGALLAGRRVALVDDVMTTGATAREAAATLLRAGAASVVVWALARTA